MILLQNPVTTVCELPRKSASLPVAGSGHAVQCNQTIIHNSLSGFTPVLQSQKTPTCCGLPPGIF